MGVSLTQVENLSINPLEFWNESKVVTCHDMLKCGFDLVPIIPAYRGGSKISAFLTIRLNFQPG